MKKEQSSVEHVRAQRGRLASVELHTDLTRFSSEDKDVIRCLGEASKCMDDVFMVQVSESNPDLIRMLEDSKDPDDADILDYFRIMFGPWDRLDMNRPFIHEQPKPPGANFYPPDMTRQEFYDWIRNHPEDREPFESATTLIRRDGKNLIAVPYAEAYRGHLTRAADSLSEAARITGESTLKTFLKSRAKSLLSNAYVSSDGDWLDLAGPIEIVIGPYETYEDRLLGIKAAFESFLCVADREESRKLQKIEKTQEELEDSLPIPDRLKNFERDPSSSIKIVDEILTGGDARCGIQTSAFNLPNDERVRNAKGSKKVLLKNVMRAKFERCLIPIVDSVLSEAGARRVSFDAYFHHVLMHEVSHSLGPGNITVNGRETTVSRALQSQYAPIEECKADILGLLTVQRLVDRCLLPVSITDDLYESVLAGLFRSLRFGPESAHGIGVAIQLNFYLSNRAIRVERNGRFTVDENRMRRAALDLAQKILLIQAHGDTAGAKALIDAYAGTPAPAVQILDGLEAIPIDIRPTFTFTPDAP